MHVASITEDQMAELIDDAIDLEADLGSGIIRGVGADVRRFALIQGSFTNAIVLVSELPVPVPPPEPTAEEIADFRRAFAAEFGHAAS